ncbi:hypothetical protein [Mycobacterium riyadhense]|uniref:hypothetical protein n=1 Tax=Mycobacterium riyadhense TaxID=486698 RepID=UPI00195C0C86|nr:hypothetical protein [Mycobacterium riyadhense]
MRVVSSVVVIAIMDGAFTLMTAVIFIAHHLFASVRLAGLSPGRGAAPRCLP